jgi:hypothetical protein
VGYLSLLLFVLVAPPPVAQTPSPAEAGPRVGTAAPAFSGLDQFGRERTLESLMGRNGVMLVFYRSADW